MDLAAKVLGGEGANRLHRVLRSERGLTYGASADFNALKQSGDIVAQTNTRSETTGETLRLMIDEVWKLLRERVGERELDGAQDYLTGSFPLTIETPSQIALQILNAVFFGLNMNDLQTYRERVNAVTRGRRAAGRAQLPAPRQADHRPGRRRVGVREAAAGRGLRQVRGDSGLRARSRRGGSAAQAGDVPRRRVPAGVLYGARCCPDAARQGDCRQGRAREAPGNQDRALRRHDDRAVGRQAGVVPDRDLD